MAYTTPPGLFDLLPDDPKEPWRSVHLWQHVEAAIRDRCQIYGFEEIRTPIFERTELFVKGTGEDTDIVTKEMYTFDDRGGRSMTLRPEGTPSVMRAIIEHHLTEKRSIQKLYYIGPMFRYERPQAGRYRQHHQFGVEVVGVEAPEQDAELIDMLTSLYQRLGIGDIVVKINSLGGENSRRAFREALRQALEPHLADLSEDSQRRFITNPLRILDSKNPTDQEILQEVPSILDFLDTESREHFEAVVRRLDALHVPYEIDPRLVRGLDYYNRTVFEVVTGSLGAQNSVGGGGRYDGLLKSLGGPDLPGIGFATGLERVMQAMLAQNPEAVTKQGPMVTLIPLGQAARERALRLLQTLRRVGVAAVMDYGSRKLGKAMKYANAIDSRYVVVIGDEELEASTVNVKELATGQEVPVAWDSLAHWLDRQNPSYPNLGNVEGESSIDNLLSGLLDESNENALRGLLDGLTKGGGEAPTAHLGDMINQFFRSIAKASEDLKKLQESDDERESRSPDNDDPSLN